MAWASWDCLDLFVVFSLQCGDPGIVLFDPFPFPRFLRDAGFLFLNLLRDAGFLFLNLPRRVFYNLLFFPG